MPLPPVVKHTSLSVFGFLSLGVPSAQADTFGGQVHVVRSRAALDGMSIEARGDHDTNLPASIELDQDAVLIGGNFRFDWMVGDLRLGGGLTVFGVRDVRLPADVRAPGSEVWARDGLGVSVETFVGYELTQGPVYTYTDIRVSLQAFEVPVMVRGDGEESSSGYGRVLPAVGPRVGMLVPVGHSLMIDLAVYQRFVGGLEQTTAFVGLGYWENDRSDPFTDELKGSFGGEL